MASYDRRILVPYLQDVCCAEMLCARLGRDVSDYQNRVNRTSAYVNQKIVDPVAPPSVDYTGWIWLLLPAILIALGVLLLGTFVGTLLFIGGCAALYFVCSTVAEDISYQKNDYSKKYAEYSRILRYNIDVEHNMESQKRLLQRESRQLELLTNRYTAACNLRRRLYDVNVIPDKYRNVYAAYYLYNYFRTSREDDLDKIVQTMLLDDIRQQLQTVVIQNEQMMLYQREQLALQERNNKTMAENHQQEMRQLVQMEKNQQLQMDYQKMMIGNQMLTNYFLEDEYQRRR